MGNENTLILGVDTGSRGAYVSVSEDGQIHSMQTFHASSEGIDFKNYLKDLSLLANNVKIAYVEKVHSIFGASASSTFSFGRNYQSAINGLEALGIPYTLVSPKDWQRVVLGDAKKVFKKNKSKKVDTKAMARIAAQKLFGEETFLLTKRSKVPHDGLVDAALIARYGLIKSKENINAKS